jgi:phosphatidylglycerol---prolipoprotein diacylglyceryl transferase
MPRTTKKSNRHRAATASTKAAAAARQAPATPVPPKRAPATTAPARQDPAEPAAVKDLPPGLLSAKAGSPVPVADSRPGSALDSSALDMGGYPNPGAAKSKPAGPAPSRSRGKAGAKAPAAAKPAAPPAAKPAVAPADTSDGMPGWATKAVAEVLTASCWLDPGEHGDPFSATICFTGRRAGVTGKPQPGDTFWQEETVERIVPGSGPVAITAEVRGITPGDWTVTARPVTRAGRRPFRPYPPPAGEAAIPRRVPWPRRVVIPADPETTTHTAQLLFTKVPGIIRFAFASLVSLGVLAGLGLAALLLSAGHYPVLRPLVFSAAAVAAGVIGGKAWYIAVNHGRKFDGWCIQGFITGVAAVIAAAAFAAPGIPAGAFLAAATPALLIGMAIGRPGCFWAGCCTGRPTASRRGIWSSDRRVGCRREPAQLLEALAALVIGLVVLAVVLLVGLPRSGPVAVAGLAAYTLSRQFILGLRAEVPQRWRHGRQVTAVAAAIVLIASVALLAV